VCGGEGRAPSAAIHVALGGGKEVGEIHQTLSALKALQPNTERGDRGESIYFTLKPGSKSSVEETSSGQLGGCGLPRQGKASPMEVHLGQSGVRLPKENHTTSPSLRK